jgi:hypothetical protein
MALQPLGGGLDLLELDDHRESLRPWGLSKGGAT